MGRPRKHYSAKFKSQVALAALREDAPLSELSSRFGVHSSVINRWKREALASLESGFSGKQEQVASDQQDQVKALHAKIGQLTMERDFLAEASSRLGVKGGKAW